MFKIYSIRLARALSTIRLGRARASKDMFMRKLINNYTQVSENTGT